MTTDVNCRFRSVHMVLGLTALIVLLGTANATEEESRKTSGSTAPDLTVLSTQQWNNIESSVDRGLTFLLSTQRKDGSFPTREDGQPGVTSLCVMAFMADGHVPGQGPYGKQLSRAIEYVLSTQQPSGQLSLDPQGHPKGGRPNYNHAIAGLMLGEVYGMTTGKLSDQIRSAIPRALEFSRMRQTLPKRNPRDAGGWRYIIPYGPNDSDLTATSWQLMFYRSARNAEFDVPKQHVQEGMDYIRRCFEPRDGAFYYALANDVEHYASGGTVGGGVVALAMAGEHESEMAQAAGNWILRHPFNRYNRRPNHQDDRYHYSAYYCSQAMFQLGGKYWEKFYPDLQRVLLDHQRQNGSWDPESGSDRQFGNAYTTSLTILALTPPFQLLPIYQR